jgi:superoxide dismutase, Fe-Mn family
MFQASRRSFLTASAAVVASSAFGRAPAGPFTQAPLGYAFNALEPHIDAKTMEIHHGRHHAAFIGNLNNFAKDAPQVAAKPIHEVLADLNSVPEAIRTGVRNNLGGHANHTMFWQVMAPGSGRPEGELLAQIASDLGGVAKMMDDFNASGVRLFGSGWVFITVAKDGKLAIVNKSNQDSPLMDGTRVLFGNDVWEHAYYLNYQNRRADYLKTWWSVVNWKVVGERFAAAKAGTLTV